MALATVASAAGPELLPADAHRWLAGGLRAWLEAGGEAPLEEYLGLSRPSRLAWRRWRRRQLLRHAAEQLGPGLTPWRQAIALNEALAEFLEFTWPAWQSLPSPPVDADPVEAALFAMMQLGLAVPTSARTMHRALTDAPPLTVSGCGSAE